MDAKQNSRRNDFINLLWLQDEQKCLEYIDKYDDFYSAISDIHPHKNMLQLACECRLKRVAIALIDKKCDLTHQTTAGYTALLYASIYGLTDVVTHIIDNSQDTVTRSTSGVPDIIYLCCIKDTNNVIKMIDKGYDIYCKPGYSLFTTAISNENECIVKKLIDIDLDFIDQFTTYCAKFDTQPVMYDNIAKYCCGKYDDYKREIIATMNDTSPTNKSNALYQSFHTTYAVDLVDVICDFLISRIK
ncbi:MAG: hypothetical protein Faunusvirus11_7 [Faunusvirus sp.]|jgi:hypothetical protein|uniref:Uncharacterized protein n=1 Tax=Faunusvirus sp. TaxID=2487766 RepID=A0A3G4ZWT1_9VIRU|nr:MAG: hypothetical protein Faunusvirus11_7 [Faunusvirus sp.]